MRDTQIQAFTQQDEITAFMKRLKLSKMSLKTITLTCFPLLKLLDDEI